MSASERRPTFETGHDIQNWRHLVRDDIADLHVAIGRPQPEHTSLPGKAKFGYIGAQVMAGSLLPWLVPPAPENESYCKKSESLRNENPKVGRHICSYSSS